MKNGYTTFHRNADLNAISESSECLSEDNCSPAMKGLRVPVGPVSHLTVLSWCLR